MRTIKKDLYILGAGGHAKEIFFLVQRIGKWNVKGLLDINDKPTLTFHEVKIPVFRETILNDIPKGEVCLVLGTAGSTELNRMFVERYSNKFEFPNVIDPSVVMDKSSVIIGEGNVVTPHCTLTTFITIGSFNIFNLGSTIHHDVSIGSFNIISPNVNVSGGVRIGDLNYFGVKATILQYLNIGNSNVIGAASLVTKDITNDMTVIGIPAKKYGNE